MDIVKCKGFFQSDIIIRTALLKGIQDLRQNPYLLDFVFASLIQDDLTSQEYGQSELDKAKNWFLSTDIPVSMSYYLEGFSTPRIAISLLDSAESTSTLGDINPEDSSEDIETIEIIQNPISVIGPFTPSSYDSTTGKIYVPDNFDMFSIFEGMYILDKTTNTSYQITEVGDTYFSIAAGTKANFTNSLITHVSNLLRVNLEALEFRETYKIEVLVSSNPTHLLYLWSIVSFILLKYKQDYLEARGFERSTVNSQAIQSFGSESGPEFIYQRAIMLTGFVRQYWPKTITPKIDGIAVGLLINNELNPNSPEAIIDQVQDQKYGMEDDDLGFGPH